MRLRIQKLMNQPITRTLEGVTLKTILETLVAEYGWEELGRQVHIRCFNLDPSINSSLKFLRKTQWAREKVEVLYLLGIKNNHKR